MDLSLEISFKIIVLIKVEENYGLRKVVLLERKICGMIYDIKRRCNCCLGDVKVDIYRRKVVFWILF